VKTEFKPSTASLERRSGHDRRQREDAPPRGWDRRRGVEPRRPEVVELDLTPSQWDALGGDGVASTGSAAAKPAVTPTAKR
jgi:hypothetical protein